MTYKRNPRRARFYRAVLALSLLGIALCQEHKR